MRFIGLACSFALVLGGACAPTPSTKDEPSKEKAAAPEKVPSPVAKKEKSKAKPEQGAKAKQKPSAANAQKAPKPKATGPAGPELIVNGDFEALGANGVPKGWSVAENVDNSWTPVTDVKAPSAASGSTALKLQAKNNANVVAVSQPINMNRFNLGRDYVFSVKFKAPANAVQATLKYKAGDRMVERRLVPKGTGDWEQLSVPLSMQRYVDPQSIRMSIYRVPNQQGEVLIDDVSLLMQPEGAPTAAAPATPAVPAAPEASAPAAAPEATGNK